MQMGTARAPTAQDVLVGMAAIESAGENITLEDALRASNCLFCRELDKSHIVDLPPGSVSPINLPIKALNPQSTSLTHFFDMTGAQNY